MNKYQAGRRFEWRVRRRFEKDGYFVVRAAGSKGPVDLVAARKSWLEPVAKIATVCFIQCKVRSGRKKKSPLIEKAATQLKTLADQYGAAAVWAVRVGRSMSIKWL